MFYKSICIMSSQRLVCWSSRAILHIVVVLVNACVLGISSSKLRDDSKLNATLAVAQTASNLKCVHRSRAVARAATYEPQYLVLFNPGLMISIAI